ncbi:Replication protein A 14 kDa subunit [Microtus ochrogaster]|uniref:Replication protein A 14 kDa subunit n=1 Tax=Microtus ochrogaster TaxID=79684 RepID=A0A8J6GQD3_MICOH|nr:Replication protein A 14 kDa subunit [Microtus ochrogaster]
MVDILELPRARVNASMLTQFIDRPVCFVGRLEKVRGLGKRAGHRGRPGVAAGWEAEGGQQLDEEISGVVEVVGKVTAKATIMCASYIQFKEDCARFAQVDLCEFKASLVYKPDHGVSHEEDRGQHINVHVDVKANKHQIKQAVKKLYDTDVAKVNTLIRPDGEKRAYVQLAPDYDALNVANKTGFI